MTVVSAYNCAPLGLAQQSKYICMYIFENMAFKPSKPQRVTKRKYLCILIVENSSAHAVQSTAIAAKPKIKNAILNLNQPVVVLRVCVCMYAQLQAWRLF